MRLWPWCRADKINHRLNQLLAQGQAIMAAIDDLKAAVDSAVAEMSAAADFIRNHPATNNDPALADFASRLQAAAEALHGVDQEPAPTPTPEPTPAPTEPPSA